MTDKLGLPPHQLNDADLERELRYMHQTREETFFNGSRQALVNHTERMLELEREYTSRFPKETEPDPRRTRKGARQNAGQPAEG